MGVCSFPLKFTTCMSSLSDTLPVHGSLCGNWFALFVCSPAELPRSEVCGDMEPEHYTAPPCVSNNGFLFKTGSMARAITERKAREGNLLTIKSVVY